MYIYLRKQFVKYAKCFRLKTIFQNQIVKVYNQNVKNFENAELGSSSKEKNLQVGTIILEQFSLEMYLWAPYITESKLENVMRTICIFLC